MKTSLGFLLFLVSLTASGQEVMVASSEQQDETFDLYKKANESLNSGNTKLAINIFDQVIKIYEEEGRVKELSESYLGMALCFALNGHYSESIRYHKKALKAHRKYRPLEAADEIKMNLGLAYQLAGKERKSKRYLN